MNEQLRQLEHQCWEVRQYNPPWFNATKFAELIVRECMACSTWVGRVNKTAIEPVHTAHAINQRIKQHFGVEE